MVGIAAGTARDMQGEERVHAEGAEEFLDQVGIHLAEALTLE